MRIRKCLYARIEAERKNPHTKEPKQNEEK
jgi:hypothetical protein